MKRITKFTQLLFDKFLCTETGMIAAYSNLYLSIIHC